MKTPMMYADESARSPYTSPFTSPLRFSGLGGVLGHAAQLLRRLFGATPPTSGAGDPSGPQRRPSPPLTAVLAAVTPGDDLSGLAFVYPAFEPSYLARPVPDPDEDPDQPDPPPTSGFRVEMTPSPFDRLLLVLRNVFGGDPPGKGLKPWSR